MLHTATNTFAANHILISTVAAVRIFFFAKGHSRPVIRMNLSLPNYQEGYRHSYYGSNSKNYVNCSMSFITVIQVRNTISFADVGHTASARIAFCNMAGCGEYIKSEFPLIDDDLYLYVEGMCCYCEL